MVIVVTMGEMNLDDWDEKSGKKNDYDEVDGMKQEVIPKAR